MLAMQQMMWDWIIFCRLAWNAKSKTKAIDRSVARESRSPTTRYLYMTLEQMQEVLNEMLSVQQELQNSQLKFTESLSELEDDISGLTP